MSWLKVGMVRSPAEVAKFEVGEYSYLVNPRIPQRFGNFPARRDPPTSQHSPDFKACEVRRRSCFVAAKVSSGSQCARFAGSAVSPARTLATV
jgi:hypothetical protein